MLFCGISRRTVGNPEFTGERKPSAEGYGRATDRTPVRAVGEGYKFRRSQILDVRGAARGFNSRLHCFAHTVYIRIVIIDCHYRLR